MRHLLNISAYPFDLERNGGVEGLSGLCRRLGLDGLELLTGHGITLDGLKGLALGAHLPYAVDWRSIWEGGSPPEGLGDEDLLFYSFGRDREGVLSTLRRSWEEAAVLEPAYGVFHAGSPSLDRIFSQDFPFGDREVLESLVEMLNRAVEGFPGGEPPFPLMLENLWWPGLRFLDAEEHRILEEGLSFRDWGYCLDIGHLMSSLRDCRREGQAIDRVMEHLQGLPEGMLERVKVLHLHLSLSAQYQEETMAAGEPEGYLEGDHRHRLRLAFPHFSAIDWHAPFHDPRCRDIVSLVDPDFVTHEFICVHPEDMEAKLAAQVAHFRPVPRPGVVEEAEGPRPVNG